MAVIKVRVEDSHRAEEADLHYACPPLPPPALTFLSQLSSTAAE